MARQELVGLLLGGQGLIEKSIDGMSDEQLSAVPEGMSNNILWNLGHLAHSLAGMTYSRSGLDYPLPEAFPDQFKGGSSPSTWEEAPSVSEVVESFKKLTPRVTDDLLAGKFDSYEAFDLMPGFTMGSIEQVLGFHLMHTGMHMHAIGAIKKALG
jgi:hypothetical protein